MCLLGSCHALPMGIGAMGTNGEDVCGGGLTYMSCCFGSGSGFDSGVGSGAAWGR